MGKKLKLLAAVLLVLGLILIMLVVLGVFKEKEYTISFSSVGGNDVSSLKVLENNTISKPADPVREGYKFLYWTLNGVEYDFSTKVTGNITLEAKWEEIIKTIPVTFTINGEAKTKEIINFNDFDFNELGFEEKDGYEIVWYVDGKELDKNMAVTEGMNIEGKYVKTTTLTVKFNSDGGTKVSNQSVKPNETAREPSGVTKYGYILNGWYLNNKKYDFSTPVTKGITLVAKWDEDPSVPRYTVKFDSDGGSKVADKKVIENQTVSAPSKPTKDGFVFEDWYLNDKKFDFKTKITEDITLKAKWQELAKYTVTFDSDNGNENIVKTVTEGETVSAPSNPTKSGYTFKEWQLNGSKYDFKSKVTSDITLKAVYTQNPVQQDTYTITVSKVDLASPDRILKVYKNNSQISFKNIKYTDGTSLCNNNCGGNQMITPEANIVGETEFIVVLNDNTEVRAKIR